MKNNLKVLIAEDQPANARMLDLILKKKGFDTRVVENGIEALKLLNDTSFDILLTDWMMPEMDGIQLIREVRANLKYSLLVIMITTMGHPEARAYALQSGADDFITKPYTAAQVLRTIDNILKRLNQTQPDITGICAKGIIEAPPFGAVAIAASTGGPETFKIFLNNLAPCNAVFLIVQHGPKWMLEVYAKYLQKFSKMPVMLAKEGMVPEKGKIYLSPGERHLILESDPLLLRLNDGPQENFVKPSADLLFKSAASAFGKYCLSIVLTGMGCDGTIGAAYVASAGGKVYVQEPNSAVAKNMPRSVIASGIEVSTFKVDEMGKAIENQVAVFSDQLN